MCFEMVEAMNI